MKISHISFILFSLVMFLACGEDDNKSADQELKAKQKAVHIDAREDASTLVLAAIHIGIIDADIDKNSSNISVVDLANKLEWNHISPSRSHAAGIKKDGTLWVWKLSSKRNGTVDKNSLIQIGIEKNWNFVSAGYRYTMAISSTGELYGWGANAHGQLGDGTKTNRDMPVRVGEASNWRIISTEYRHTMAINSKGELYGWGYNGFGQLGDGNTTNHNKPAHVAKEKSWKSVQAGTYHTTAISGDGKMYTWGYNRYGQLGSGDSKKSNLPILIDDKKTWQQLSTGGYHSLAISKDGKLYGWGLNKARQLGDGSKSNRKIPVLIKKDILWRSVLAVGMQSIAVDVNGKIYRMGHPLISQKINKKQSQVATQVKKSILVKRPKTKKIIPAKQAIIKQEPIKKLTSLSVKKSNIGNNAVKVSGEYESISFSHWGYDVLYEKDIEAKIQFERYLPLEYDGVSELSIKLSQRQ
ncbi:MAG: hypothetical protein HF962_04440 [Sulfurovum sp.]|nr:hypothetical protein [Sulfurovum sp.]